MVRSKRALPVRQSIPRTAIPPRYAGHRDRVLAILTRWERSFRQQCAS